MIANAAILRDKITDLIHGSKIATEKREYSFYQISDFQFNENESNQPVKNGNNFSANCCNYLIETYNHIIPTNLSYFTNLDSSDAFSPSSIYFLYFF